MDGEGLKIGSSPEKETSAPMEGWLFLAQKQDWQIASTQERLTVPVISVVELPWELS